MQWIGSSTWSLVKITLPCLNSAAHFLWCNNYTGELSPSELTLSSWMALGLMLFLPKIFDHCTQTCCLSMHFWVCVDCKKCFRGLHLRIIKWEIYECWCITVHKKTYFLITTDFYYGLLTLVPMLIWLICIDSDRWELSKVLYKI